MEEIQVVILMATYNGEKYLKEQIESLLKQNGVRYEILVRDDGSSDGTTQILDYYQKQGALKWFTSEHVSVAEGFLTLLEQAPEADYYAFCDQDDVWDDDKLSCAVSAMKYFPVDDCVLYCCGSRLVDKELHYIKDHKMDEKRTKAARLFFAKVAGNTMVFNHALRKKIMQYHPTNMLLHDTWIYKVGICIGAHLVIDPNPHLDYRQHDNNAVGMELNITQKINRFFEIIHNKNIYPQLMEIKDAYEKEIMPEYLEILTDFEKAKISAKYRRKLAFDKRIDFNNRFFNLAFKVKMLTNSL